MGDTSQTVYGNWPTETYTPISPFVFLHKAVSFGKHTCGEGKKGNFELNLSSAQALAGESYLRIYSSDLLS